MSKKKILRDYGLEESINESGRIEKTVVYRGKYHSFVLPAEEVKAQAIQCLIGCVFSWLCFISSLLLNTGSMRHIYIALPYVFAAVPLWIMTRTMLGAVRSQKDLENRDAEALENSLPAACVFGFVLPAAALLGIAVSLIFGIGSFFRSDLPFALLCAGSAAGGIFCFLRRKTFKTQENK